MIPEYKNNIFSFNLVHFRLMSNPPAHVLQDQQGGNAYIHANDIVDALKSKYCHRHTPPSPLPSSPSSSSPAPCSTLPFCQFYHSQSKPFFNKTPPPFLPLPSPHLSFLFCRFDSKGFSQLVFYLEACESGSIFDGLLPANINVYASPPPLA